MVQSSSSELSSFLPFFSLTATETETLIKVFKLTKKKVSHSPTIARRSQHQFLHIYSREKKEKRFFIIKAAADLTFGRGTFLS